MKTIITLLSIFFVGLANAFPSVPNDTITQNYECTSINKRFVHLPVKTGALKTWMTVNVDGKLQHEFLIELAPENPDFYVTIEVGQWMGKKLILTAEKILSDSKWISMTKMSDEMSDQDIIYTETYRPQFHFSPRRGRASDPNGLVYYNGLYHLFFQHCPYATQFGLATWGHAISKDLFHWIEQPDAILPDKNGVVFSGSAVVDWKNASGLQKNPIKDKTGKIINPPLVAFYTSWAAKETERRKLDDIRGGGPDAKATQSMAYSLNEGKTWVKYSNNPIIPHIIGGNRDPKVFWYEDKQNPSNPNSGRWILALYFDRQDYALFSSKNLINWEKMSDIKNIGCSECPDMFELPVDDNKKNSRWVFWGGNGNYLIGSFDGKTFTKESGPFASKYGGNDYAAQTFNDIPVTDGRRIQLSWMAGGDYPKMPFNQQHSVPRNLTLRTTPDGIRLFMEPVKEIEKLRMSKPILFAKSLQGSDNPLKVSNLNGDMFDIELVFNLNKKTASSEANVLSAEIFGQKITYNVIQQYIDLEGISASLAPNNNKIKLRIIIDRTSIELFANDGIVQIAKCFVNKDKVPADMTISGKKGSGNVEVKAYQLKSVWGK